MATISSRLYSYYSFLSTFARDELFRKDEVPFKPADYPDLSSQVWIVTGGNTGIGYNVVLELVKKGAKVWIASRTESKLKEAVTSIKQNVPNAKLDYFVVDFNDLSTIKPGVKKFLDAEKLLNGVVHNAGIMNTPMDVKSKQGFERQLSTNNLASFLLQKLLDPLLISSSARSSTPGRITWTSSLAHMTTPFPGGANFKDPLDVGSENEAYSVSKAINVLQSILWTRHHADANVVSVSLHPGILKTALFDHTNAVVDKVMGYWKWEPKYGAYTTLYAALSPDLTTTKNQNAYVVPWGQIGHARKDVVEAAHDPARGDVLWKWFETQVAPYA